MNIDIKNMIITIIILLLLDLIYINCIYKTFSNQIYDIQNGSNMKINVIGAIICYIFLSYGLNYFILKDKKSTFDAFKLGLVIYGVYDTTNYATFEKWNYKFAIIDTLWGGILFYLTTFLMNKFFL
jgi:uncharacterized membrane protein